MLPSMRLGRPLASAARALLLAEAIVAVGLSACSSDEPRQSSPKDGGTNPILHPDASSTDDGGPSDSGSGGDASTPDGGGQCSSGPRKPRAARLGIVNGTRQPQLVPLTPEQQRAVVGVGQQGTSGSFCSGTLISEQVVLTAVHCTQGEVATTLRVLFGPDDYAPEYTVPVASKREHPSVDLALLILQSAPTFPVTPIPILPYALTSVVEGQDVETAGFGDTQSSATGRFFAVERLYNVDPSTFDVDGFGQRGVCFGDSGGPALYPTPEGDVRTLGDLSEGDANCGNQDTFVRADAVRAWIEQSTGPTPGAGPVACGTIDAVGRCGADGVSVRYCDAGALISASCGGGEVCGWSTAQAGWRCVPAASDPCQGLSLLGACRGEVARWCVAGQIQEFDCGACGEHCLYQGDAQGYDCLADANACAGLDFLGHCQGNTAEWCNQENRRERLDCAGQGQVCRWVDATTGYYCADP